MSEQLDQEIRTLQSIFRSGRDPDGLAFAPLADAFLRKGDRQEAFELLMDGTWRHPEFATGHVVLTRLYLSQGRWDAAEEAARRVLELDPENVTALSALVTVLHDRGANAEAARLRSTLLAADPDSDEALACLELVIPEPPPDAAAVRDAEAGSAVESEDGGLEGLFASVGEGDGEAPEGHERGPEEGEAPPAEAEQEESAVDREVRRLRSLYRSDLDPEGLAFASLAQAYLRKGERREALDLLLDGTWRHPKYATGHVVLTRLYLDQGRFDAAEQGARRVLELDPENLFALSTMVTVLHEKGEDAEAARYRAWLLETDPDSDEASAALALDLPDVELVAEPEAPAVEVAEAADVQEPAVAAAPSVEFDPMAGLDDWVLDEAGAPTSHLLEEEAEVSMEPRLEEATTEAPAVEPVYDLELLAPGELPRELGELEPEEPPLDLEALAPDEEPLELGALAPDEEPVLELGALAPDEEVLELGALAPDEEPVLELGALAPDEEVLELGALAPDEEPVLELGALAPDEEALEPSVLAPYEPVLDLGLLAPDQPVPELEALVPEEAPAEPEEVVLDLSTLAPDDVGQPPAVEVPEALELAPFDFEGLEEEEAAGESEPVYTRTLAELYLRQGVVDQALEVYRHLLEASPDDTGLREVVDALEAGEPVPVPAERDEEEIEVLARDLAESGVEAHEVDTPFAWADEAEGEPVTTDPAGVEPISAYFDRLLDWDSRERS